MSSGRGDHPSLLSTLKTAFAIAREEADGYVRRCLAATLVLVIATAAFAALGPLTLKFAIDTLAPAAAAGAAAQPLPRPAGEAAPQFMEALGPAFLVLAYVACLGLSRAFGEARWFFSGVADQRLHRALSRRLLAHIIDLPLAFHLDRKTGALNQILVQGLAGYRILLNHLVFTVLPVTVEIVLVAIILFTLFRPEFLLIFAATVAFHAAVFALAAKRIVGPTRAVSATQVEAYASLTDSLLNAETVKCFNAERQVRSRYDAALAQAEGNWRVFYWRKSENGLLAALVFALSLGAAMTLGVSRVNEGAISVGDFVLVNAYMLQIVRPLETLGAAFRDIAHGTAFIEKMTEVLAKETETPRVNPVAGARNHPSPSARLELRGVSFSYLSGRRVLKDIGFTLEPGKTLAIVGGSGAGKSSLVRLVMGFYTPDEGDILLNGRSIHDTPLDDLRRAVAIVPQDTVLFNDTIAFNIGFARPGATQKEIEDAARFAHIHERILAMPDGYETKVGERGLKLSGGEKQRVSIARAVLKRPQLFIFDEATSSLDSHTEAAILDNLIEISKAKTTLIISHRLSMVVHADEILVIENGMIAERGAHDALLRQSGAYASMWRTQHKPGARVTLLGKTEMA